MSRVQGPLGCFLRLRRHYGQAASATHTVDTCTNPTLDRYQHVDRDRRSSFDRLGVLGHCPPGLPQPRLDGHGALGGLPVSLQAQRFMSAGKSSLFEGLKLQVPSNPFAPRKPRPAVQKLVLYRGRGMLLFRFVVRAKVFQLMGFLACAVFASVVLTTSNPDPLDLAAVGALAVGCVVTSYCIWYYSGRYVGEMSLLLPERRVVRFSVLDFWGNREDNDVPLERMVAPWHKRSIAEVRTQARQALMPVEVTGDRQYYISVPHGHVLQKEILQRLLYGAPLDEAQDAEGVKPDGTGESAAPKADGVAQGGAAVPEASVSAAQGSESASQPTTAGQDAAGDAGSQNKP